MVTNMSSRGQIVLPKPIRTARGWREGTAFEVIETAEGVLLKPARVFAPTRLEDVKASAGYRGPRKTLADMQAAIVAEAGRRGR